jgi:GTPase-activating protein BEM2
VRGKKDSLISSPSAPVADKTPSPKPTGTRPSTQALTESARPPRVNLLSQTDTSAPRSKESELEDSLISVFDGELLLGITRSHNGSKSSVLIDRLLQAPTSPATKPEHKTLERRPSQAPSIRVSSAAGLERKQSTARLRRSSLPSISQRSSIQSAEPSLEPPVRVTVAGGTLDRLVDVLIGGLEGIGVSIADDNGEMPLREGSTRPLFIERSDFSRIWWGVFRSFVTPFVLFEVNFLVCLPFQHSHSFLF